MNNKFRIPPTVNNNDSGFSFFYDYSYTKDSELNLGTQTKVCLYHVSSQWDDIFPRW